MTSHSSRHLTWTLEFLFLDLLTATLCSAAGLPSASFRHDGSLYGISSEWPNFGGGNGLENLRWSQAETKISKSSVQKLATIWTHVTDGAVSATPSVADGMVYFPDWKGSIYAVKQSTGKLVWKKNVTAITRSSRAVLSRTTPVIAGKYLVIGIYGPCVVVALDRRTGDFLWSTKIDSHPFGVVTQSPTIFEGDVYIGSSSLEETSDEQECCNFQGAFFKLKLTNGAIVWKVPMIPDNGGATDQYSGNAIWGSNPPLDVKRRRVYITTGNNYGTPAAIAQCEIDYRNQTNPPSPDPCLEDDNHVESMLAIDIDSGSIAWSTHLGGYDTWILVCSAPSETGPNCPAIPGPDFDFGMSPMLITVPDLRNCSTGNSSKHSHPRRRDLAVAGQKSGIIWALDRDTGEIVWSTDAGPGGFLGGASWGMSTDETSVFANIINNVGLNFTLEPSTAVTTSGGWVALNSTTGSVLWSTANPFTGWTPAPVSHANGVVFGASATTPPGVVAMDAKTGKILKKFQTNGTVFGGPSIVDGCIYIPEGASRVITVAASLANRTLNPGHSIIAACV
ncbi:hypothetical protein Mapa_016382 [Marchantia paleacea]|nr:hypothetical protein Mapa_016382 [Marchantia paleacea]